MKMRKCAKPGHGRLHLGGRGGVLGSPAPSVRTNRSHLSTIPQSGHTKDNLWQLLVSPWCMQNTCMNFVVYWCIFLHIIMLLVVITMIRNDFWGFSIDPLILVIIL
jgi:hypothetical protein